MRLLEMRVLRRPFGPKRKDNREWKKLSYEELNDM
jgi:hypothetical protein